LKALPNVKDVYPSISVPVQLKINAYQALGTAVGVPMSVANEGAFRTMTAGGFFPNDTDDTCILSNEMAKAMLGDTGQVSSLVGH
jgi:hypothetical protein